MSIRIFTVLVIWASACWAKLPDAMTETFRDYLQTGRFVVLVCVFNESFEKRSAPDKHRLWTDATIVRSIKGEWEIGKKIRYYTLLEAAPSEMKSEIGVLRFLFLESMPKGEFMIGTGDAWRYEPELDIIIQKPKS